MIHALLLAAAAATSPAHAEAPSWSVGLYPIAGASCFDPAPSVQASKRIDMRSGEQIDWTKPVGRDPYDRSGLVVRLVPDRLAGRDVTLGDVRVVRPGTRTGALAARPLVTLILSRTVIQAVCVADPASHGRTLQVRFRPN